MTSDARIEWPTQGMPLTRDQDNKNNENNDRVWRIVYTVFE